MRRVSALLVTAALALSLSGCGLFTDDTPIDSVGSAASSPAPSPPPRVRPSTISIPAIGADSTLIPLGIQNGAIEIPSVQTPEQAGWYCPIVVNDCGAPYPGEVGPAVILGHVDGSGKRGVFFDLKNLKQGDEIRIVEESGETVLFSVYTVERHDKDDFPFQRVFGNTSAPELRLITCGGPFDRDARSYEDNIIAYATRVS